MTSPDIDIPRDEFPTRFEIPRTPITPQEILTSLEMHEHDVHVDLHSADSLARIRYPLPAHVDPENQFADAFVYWGQTLSNLHGTYMEPSALFEYLAPVDVSPAEAEARLLGASYPRRTPWVTLESDDHLVRVNVFSGATTWQAKEISSIGDAGEFTTSERIAYQKALFEVFTPIAQRSYNTTHNALGLYSTLLILHDIEDCAATGDTLAGVSRILEQYSAHQQLPFAGRRIDIAVATGQALTVLAHESQRVGQPVEINVGYVAWGLSRGVGPELEHKNYITHAPFSIHSKAFGEKIFVVGDMGNAAKRIGDHEYPWEKFRRDYYGLEGGDGRPVASYQHLSDAGSLRLAYANGGLLMTAFADAAVLQLGKDIRSPTIIAVGKRLDFPQQGFALRIDHFLGPLQDYLNG